MRMGTTLNANGHYASGGPVMAGVYDTGGLLRNGQAAVNLSGRPERILNPDQTRKFDQVMATPGGTQTPMIGTFVLQPAPGESTQEQIERVNFELRRIRRGAG